MTPLHLFAISVPALLVINYFVRKWQLIHD